MTNWKTLSDYFLNLVNHPRYGTHAREMFKLILALREQPELANVRAEVDYLYVTLSRQNMDGVVIVNNEQSGLFAVTASLDDPNQYFEDEFEIPFEFVPPLIAYQLQKLSDAAFSIKFDA